MFPKIEKLGYTRVSTRDQEPENQIRLIQAEGIPPDYIFVDRGISGTIPAEKRPGFKKLMDYISANPGEIKYLYVYEISRLGRTFLETAVLMEKLEKMGIMVWSLSPNEQFTQNQDKSIRQLLMAIMLWVAQRERDNLVARTKAGLERAEAEGKQIGRPRIEIDWVSIEKARSDGASWENISEATGIPVMTLWRHRKRKGMV